MKMSQTNTPKIDLMNYTTEDFYLIGGTLLKTKDLSSANEAVSPESKERKNSVSSFFLRESDWFLKSSFLGLHKTNRLFFISASYKNCKTAYLFWIKIYFGILTSWKNRSQMIILFVSNFRNRYHYFFMKKIIKMKFYLSRNIKIIIILYIKSIF